MQAENVNNEPAIKVEDITKVFKEQAGSQTLKNKFVNLSRMLSGKKKKKNHKGDFTALKNIDFEVKKGEFFGIVGRNGSGKSTLLKIIAGIYTPTEGAVTLNGKLTPFIELGVGFNPELSGKDNVYLNAALLGFNRRQTDKMYEDIVEFAELKDFMNTKLKNYSSGMQVRLAFSVAIRAESDILLIDEVLAVGDAAFQKKCFDYFQKLKEGNKTVIFVTHDMNSVEKFCDRVLVINKSESLSIGSPVEGAILYKNILLGNNGSNKNAKPTSEAKKVFEKIEILNRSQDNIVVGDKLNLEIKINYKNIDSKIWAPGPYKMSATVYNETGILVASSEFGDISKKNEKIGLVISTNELSPSKYYLYFGIYGEKLKAGNECIESTFSPITINIIQQKGIKVFPGIMQLDADWDK